MPADPTRPQQDSAQQAQSQQYFVATNAASSGIKLERKTIKTLGKRSDKPGLIFNGDSFHQVHNLYS